MPQIPRHVPRPNYRRVLFGRKMSTPTRIQELPPSPTHYPYNPAAPYNPPAPTAPYAPTMPPPPALFTTPPVLRDAHVTPTSLDQEHTATLCLRYIAHPTDPLPILDRQAHIAFLSSALSGQLPSYMVALDASRAWIIYWCLQGLSSLGAPVSQYRDSVIGTLSTMQNSTGGFGGGNGQMSHITATYAAVLALCLVSTPEDTTPLDIVDRRALLRYLNDVKTPTGSFRVALNGEADVRGVYCAVTLAALLQLPAVPLFSGTREWLVACQTYEGGFGMTPGGNEAHGGYAFCALAALCMLAEPRVALSGLDVGALVAWLSARQYAPEGGFSGRAGKLVDGCYSTWVGGCWALVEAALNGPQEKWKEGVVGKGVVGSLWSREGLARYILSCCQSPNGGLRDKPAKGPDYYHTCYILLGLSSTQHYFYYIRDESAPIEPIEQQPEVEEDDYISLTSAFLWRVTTRIPSVVKGVEEPVIEDLPAWPDDVAEEGAVGDRLVAQHPLFNVPFENIRAVEAWAKEKVGF